jgi:23S rRNA (pseudouridine1915-N3)-methyltransferase
MEIRVIAVGKCRDRATLDLCQTYLTRLGPLARTEVVEVTPRAPGRDAEAEALLARVPAGAGIVTLDERGKQLDTKSFSKMLTDERDHGTRCLCFLIGGADGHGDAVRQAAKRTVSLSALTFPHMLVRPILLEQIYRGLTLASGHPYHRE